MRIAYLFDRPLPATETDSEQVMQTVAALTRVGVDVTLILPCVPGRAPSKDELAEYYGVRGSFQLELLPQRFAFPSDIRKWLHATSARAHARGFDVLYTRNFPTLFLSALGDLPFAYETYRPWFDQFPFLRMPFRASLGHPRCLGTILHSHFARARYESLGVAKEKLLVAHNGYDPERMLKIRSRDEARAILSLPSDRPIVSYTGHVNATKGIDTIIAMAKRVPEALFLLVGHDGKRGLIERLASRVSNVQLVPWQPFDRVATYLIASDVLLLPPSGRGLSVVGNTVLPMKLFQYLAAGRPILAPSTGDVVELLRDGENALLVPPGDVEQAVAKLRAVLASEAQREHLSANARATSQGLTWDARAAKIAEFLERRLAANRGERAGRSEQSAPTQPSAAE